MNLSLTQLFESHKVNSPELLADVRKLLRRSMISSREFGKKLNGTMLTKYQEEIIWNDIERCFNELKASDNSIFAQQNVDALKENYRIVRK